MINKKTLITEWFPLFIIPGSIFFDLLNGYIQIVLNKDFSIGVLYRGIIFLVLFPFVLKKRSILTYFGVFIIFLFVISNFFWLITQKFYDFAFEIKMISRSLYLYVISSFLLYYRNSINELKLLNCVSLFGAIGGGAIVFSFIFGIGLDTYGDYSFGIKSFFPAQNDTSLSLLLSLLIVIYLLLTQKKLVFYFYSIVITAGCIFLGTRAGIAGSILIWAVIFVGIIFFRFKDLNLSRISKNLMFFFVFGVLTVGGFFIYKIITENQYILNKFTLEALLGGRHSRGWLAEAGLKIISDSDFGEFFFGHGKFAFSKEINYLGEINFNELSYAEIDFLDYIGSYGIILGGFFLMLPFVFFLKSKLMFFKTKTLFYFVLLIGFVVYVGHSFYAGHALNSPIVSSVFSVFVFFVLKYDPQKMPFSYESSID
ncbi:O-antigen ligase family protein [Thermophagus sp. OGC60D27]|uniref:O-antigen ligase family protein n=1 Tax=Thermophagus sp. OGC60D27 TaxID=3458415 RepID=UPI004038279D